MHAGRVGGWRAWVKYRRSARAAPRTDRTPPVTSEWPPMNLVMDVMQMSAPRSSGLWNTGARMLHRPPLSLLLILLDLCCRAFSFSYMRMLLLTLA